MKHPPAIASGCFFYRKSQCRHICKNWCNDLSGKMHLCEHSVLTKKSSRMKLNFTLKTLSVLAFLGVALGKMEAQSSVVINEFMASNTETAADENSEFEDWVELFNNSNSAVNLGGWFLTDNPDNLDKWEFPANTSIPANGYIIIWADEDSSQGPLHANFKLSASGEQLLLVNGNGSTVQDISFGQQQADKGYARSPNGTGNFVIKNPTFKANNDTGISAVGNVEQQDLLDIFPNPVSDGTVVLRSENTENQKVAIYDQLGRLRLQTSFFTQTSLDLSDWPVGVYIVKSSAGQQILVKQ